MTRIACALVAILLVASCSSFHRPDESGFLQRELVLGGKTYRYVVYVPTGNDRRQKLPVLLFLHGAGERGEDGLRQTEVGLGPAIRTHPERFPMIVVFPQAPPDTRWLGDEARFAMTALERAATEFRGDRRRFYLTGLSLGGYGTWHLALAHPGRFAALVPVCGGILKPEGVESVRQSPLTRGAADPYAFTAAGVGRTRVWIFHGSDDRVIPVTESREMYEELQRADGDVRYTEFPAVGHNAWDPAYSDAELWAWLLRQSLPEVVPGLR